MERRGWKGIQMDYKTDRQWLEIIGNGGWFYWKLRFRRDCRACGEGGGGGERGGRGGWKTQDSMIWRSHGYHYEDDVLSWLQPCTLTERYPKEGEIVSFFEMFVPIYMHTHNVPHTKMHSSTPMTEVVLCSDFLVPMSVPNYTRSHLRRH